MNQHAFSTLSARIAWLEKRGPYFDWQMLIVADTIGHHFHSGSHHTYANANGIEARERLPTHEDFEIYVSGGVPGNGPSKVDLSNATCRKSTNFDTQWLGEG